MKHYHVTPSDEYKCSCGKAFESLSEIWSHVDSHSYTEVTDGVTKCPDCKGAAYLPKLEGCQNVGHKNVIWRADELVPDALWDAQPGHAHYVKDEVHLLTLELLRRARKIFFMKDDCTPESINHLLDDIDEYCPQFVEDEPDKDKRYGLGEEFEEALNLIEGVMSDEVVGFAWYDEAKKFLKENGRDVDDS